MDLKNKPLHYILKLFMSNISDKYSVYNKWYIY